ncbi:MAG: RNHCP domain-containing protein [Acetobacteraceae bacterium]|nr:RNHCP domain-containing protein [Acetobacteraceae bacterium]
MSRRFLRTVEDFTCHKCGARVKGDGYTDHCPRCLWSLHTDVNPGDRAAGCLGPMEPVGVEQRRGRFVIVHRCLRCGAVRRVRSAVGDSIDAILRVADGAARRGPPGRGPGRLRRRREQ